MRWFSKVTAFIMICSEVRSEAADMATPCARPSIHRLALRGTIVLVVALVSASGLSRSVCASQFLDDFESDGEVSQIPAPSLHNWNIISSVDLLTESNAPLCRLSGSCIDLVGTAGTRNGGVVTKRIFPLATMSLASSSTAAAATRPASWSRPAAR